MPALLLLGQEVLVEVLTAAVPMVLADQEHLIQVVEVAGVVVISQALARPVVQVVRVL
jgi:hypothetical protein